MSQKQKQSYLGQHHIPIKPIISTLITSTVCYFGQEQKIDRERNQVGNDHIEHVHSSRYLIRPLLQIRCPAKPTFLVHTLTCLINGEAVYLFLGENPPSPLLLGPPRLLNFYKNSTLLFIRTSTFITFSQNIQFGKK